MDRCQCAINNAAAQCKMTCRIEIVEPPVYLQKSTCDVVSSVTASNIRASDIYETSISAFFKQLNYHASGIQNGCLYMVV